VWHAIQAEDQKALAARLGVPFDTLVVVKVSGEGDAWFVPLPLDAKGKGSAHLKVGQAAVDAAIADETPEGKRKSLPAFPSPDKPRKQVRFAHTPVVQPRLHKPPNPSSRERARERYYRVPYEMSQPSLGASHS
jgi:hypothetical protein